MILSMLSNHRAGLRHTLVILGLIALWLAIGSVGGVAQGKLSSVQKNDNGSFLPTSAESALGASPTGGTSGLKAWVTGPAAYVADLVAAFGGIDGVLLLVALAAVFLILVLVYRSPFLPLVVILTAVFALTGAGLVVYELAKAGTITLNGQAQGILSILVVGASVDYCLLIVARYREELRHVSSPHTAMVRALRASIPPVAASAGTVLSLIHISE